MTTLPPESELERLLARKLEEATADALANGSVEPEALRDLDGLARLVAIRNSTKQEAPSRPVALVVFAMVLIAMAWLLFSRTGSAPLAATIASTRVKATVVTDSSGPMLAASVPLRSIRVSGFGAVEVPSLEPPLLAAQSLAQGPVRFTVSGESGKLSMVNLTLPAGSALDMSAERNANGSSFRLSSGTSPPSLMVVADGSIEMLTEASLDPLPIRLNGARAFTFHSADSADRRDPVTLELDLLDALTCFGQQFTLRDIDVADRPTVVVDTSEAQRVPASTLTSGELTFIDFSERRLLLRPGQRVEFDDVTLDLHQACVGDGQIRLAGEARVADVRLGQDRRSAMPTWLEWIRERQPLILLAGAVSYVFSLFWTVSLWWRRSP